MERKRIEDFVSGHGWNEGGGRGCVSRGKRYGRNDSCSYGDGKEFGRIYGSGEGYAPICGSEVLCEEDFGTGITEYNGRPVCKVFDRRIVILSTPTEVRIESLFPVKAEYATGMMFRRNVADIPCFVAKYCGYLDYGDTIGEALGNAYGSMLFATPSSERARLIAGLYPDIDAVIGVNALCEVFHVLSGMCGLGYDGFCGRYGLDPDSGKMTLRQFLAKSMGDMPDTVVAKLEEKYGLKI